MKQYWCFFNEFIEGSAWKTVNRSTAIYCVTKNPFKKIAIDEALNFSKNYLYF